MEMNILLNVNNFKHDDAMVRTFEVIMKFDIVGMCVS
jgi:hypothetical protein